MAAPTWFKNTAAPSSAVVELALDDEIADAERVHVVVRAAASI